MVCSIANRMPEPSTPIKNNELARQRFVDKYWDKL